MNRIVLAAMLCPLFSLNVQAQSPANPAGQEGILVGAYEPAPSDTPLVAEARSYVQNHLARLSVQEVDEAFIQVVDGLNVKLICEVTAEDGPSTWQFVVYRSLKGQWQLQSAHRLNN